jgi:hypothetical protein
MKLNITFYVEKMASKSSYIHVTRFKIELAERRLSCLIFPKSVRHLVHFLSIAFP